MPIASEALAAPLNLHLHLPGGMSLREAFRRLIAADEGEPWWHLVVRVGHGTWATATFDRLACRAREEPRLLDSALRDLAELLPARAVEQDNLGTAEARRLAQESPGLLLVVTRGGELVGILRTPLHGGETDSREGVQRLLDSEPPLAVHRYTDVSCPDRVALDTSRFSVVVRLTVERPPFDLASRPLNPALGAPVRVELQAPGFELLNGREQEIQVLPDRDSPAVVFDLRPRQLGDHRLELDFFQETMHLGMVSVPVAVMESPAPARAVEAVLDLPSWSPEIAPPDRVLRIFLTRDSQGQQLRFLLLHRGGAGWDEFPPVRFDHDPATYVQGLFSGLTGLAAGTASSSARATQDALKIKGQNLWQLLPADLRALYAREHSEWRDRSLLIVSDEPYIPWELIWPWDPNWSPKEEDEGPWCVTLRLSRWLRRDDFGNGNAGAPGLLPLRSLACLVSGETGLPAVAAERELLRDLAVQHHLRYLSPLGLDHSSVLDFLRTGGYDWLHLAAHGSFSDQAPAQESAIQLEGPLPLTPEVIVGPEITRHLRQRRPAFVLNSCESARQGWDLVGLTGWASRLVSLGAGMFLGTLWPVKDDSALALVKEFYPRILAGEAVAEALRQARLAIKRQDDPSWLAYSLYGHPNAPCVALGYTR